MLFNCENNFIFNTYKLFFLVKMKDPLQLASLTSVLGIWNLTLFYEGLGNCGPSTRNYQYQVFKKILKFVS